MIRNLLSKIKDGSPLFVRVFNAIFYSLFGTAGAKVVQLICDVGVSRIIGQEAYGEYSMINSTVALFVLFAGAGVEATLTRYVSLHRDNLEKVGKIAGTLATCIGIAAMLIGLGMFMFSERISYLSCGNDVLTAYFRITSVTVLFTVMASVFKSMLSGLEEYKKIARGEIVSILIYATICILLTSEIGLYGAIISLMILHFIRMTAFYLFSKGHYKKKKLNFKFSFDEEIKRIIISFTVPAFLASIFVVPVNWISNGLIAKSFGFAELSIYSVAMQWKNMIIYIPTQMNQLRPIYADLHGKGEFETLNRLLVRSSLSSFALVSPFVVLGCMFSQFILMFYGFESDKGTLVFSIILLTMIPYSLQMQIGSYLQGVGEMWIGLFLNVIWSSVYIGGALLLSDYGCVGFASAYFISYFVHAVLSIGTIYYLNRRNCKDEKNSR